MTTKKVPSGRSIDIFNRVSRCLCEASVLTGAVVGPDLWFFFDNPSGGVKKVHEVVLAVCVSLENGLGEKFLDCLDNRLLKEYALDYDVVATLKMDTKMLGNAYSLHNDTKAAVWRTYVLWRTEGDVPRVK